MDAEILEENTVDSVLVYLPTKSVLLFLSYLCLFYLQLAACCSPLTDSCSYNASLVYCCFCLEREEREGEEGVSKRP